MNTLTELHYTQDIIEGLLRSEPELRNSDKLLTVRVMEVIARRERMWVHIPRELLEHLPAFESVKRIRAKLQNELGLYKPTDPTVQSQRKTREREVKRWVRS